MGVVYVPMTQVCYYAIAGLGAYKRTDSRKCASVVGKFSTVSKVSASRLAVSRRQDPQSVLTLFNHPKHCELVVMGGAALKSCLVAERRTRRLLCASRADGGVGYAAPRRSLLRKRAEQLMDTELQPLTYNERETLEIYFIVVGAPNLRVG